MTDDPTPEMADPGITAAELALGLLEGGERAVALRRLLADPDFAAEVDRWRAHFGMMFAQVPDAAPPADGLARLQRALAAPAANDDYLPPVRLWQGLATLASIAAAILAVVLVSQPGVAPAPGPAPSVAAQPRGALLVAALAPVAPGSEAEGPIAAVYDPADGPQGSLRIAAADLADADHSAELWVIGDDKTPHSLGLVTAAAGRTVAVDRAIRANFMAGATLAVTIEQLGGSPDGKPKGPIVAAGSLLTL